MTPRSSMRSYNLQERGLSCRGKTTVDSHARLLDVMDFSGDIQILACRTRKDSRASRCHRLWYVLTSSPSIIVYADGFFFFQLCNGREVAENLRGPTKVSRKSLTGATFAGKP